MKHIMQELTLKLELVEVNAVLDALGQLPTSSNVWPLAHKIRNQSEAQIQPKDILQEQE